MWKHVSATSMMFQTYRYPRCSYARLVLLQYTVWRGKLNLLHFGAGKCWGVLGNEAVDYDGGSRGRIVPAFSLDQLDPGSLIAPAIANSVASFSLVPLPPAANEEIEAQSGCPAPTTAPSGLTPNDPILLRWFKIPEFYPDPIELKGKNYRRDVPGQPLPFPDQAIGIGVNPANLPFVGKPLQLVNAGGSRAQARCLRRLLKKHGFDFTGGGEFGPMQIDHMLDLDWGGLDQFDNLWPVDDLANTSAGSFQNLHQKVVYSDKPGDPPNPPTSILEGKKAPASKNLVNRHFKIEEIVAGPND